MSLLVRYVDQNFLWHKDVPAVEHLTPLAGTSILLFDALLFLLHGLCHWLQSTIACTLLSLGRLPIFVQDRIIINTVCEH